MFEIRDTIEEMVHDNGTDLETLYKYVIDNADDFDIGAIEYFATREEVLSYQDKEWNEVLEAFPDCEIFYGNLDQVGTVLDPILTKGHLIHYMGYNTEIDM